MTPPTESGDTTLADRRKPTRPAIPERNKILVWAKAAGRCTFCNVLVTETTELGEAVPIGELAHVVGWSDDSPRGASPLSAEERAESDNLILACRNCHKPVDDGGVAGRYTVRELARRKREHETRVERLTAIGADRAAYVLRVIGDVRGIPAELTRQTVLAAATGAGLYPKILPGSHWDSDADLDLRGRGPLIASNDFERLVPEIVAFVNRVHDGVRRDAVTRLAIFAFARIPLLVAFGAHLDDKVPALIFQRQRGDDANAWSWPSRRRKAIAFDIETTRSGTSQENVALIVNLSGTIGVDEIDDHISTGHHVYTVTPGPAAECGPALILSAADLGSFETAMRRFLAMVEANHGKIPSIDLFAAVGLAPAITIGRVLVPNVSPAWNVFDRGPDGDFFMALQVQR